jgi:hypothetical protein
LPFSEATPCTIEWLNTDAGKNLRTFLTPSWLKLELEG